MKFESDASGTTARPGVSKHRGYSTHFLKVILMPLSIMVLVLLVLNQPAYFQNNDDRDVSHVISDVKRRFKLSAGDIKSIRPLLRRENSNVLAIYVRFSSGNEPEYSNRVWQEIIASHFEFGLHARGSLTTRQWAGLRAARSGMQALVVDYLVEDYIAFLGAFLELERWEFGDVQALFESDKARKLRLFEAANSTDIRALQSEVERITAETERKLKVLLSEDQWRDYRSLTESKVPIA